MTYGLKVLNGSQGIQIDSNTPYRNIHVVDGPSYANNVTIAEDEDLFINVSAPFGKAQNVYVGQNWPQVSNGYYRFFGGIMDNPTSSDALAWIYSEQAVPLQVSYIKTKKVSANNTYSGSEAYGLLIYNNLGEVAFDSRLHVNNSHGLEIAVVALPGTASGVMEIDNPILVADTSLYVKITDLPRVNVFLIDAFNGIASETDASFALVGYQWINESPYFTAGARTGIRYLSHVVNTANAAAHDNEPTSGAIIRSYSGRNTARFLHFTGTVFARTVQD